MWGACGAEVVGTTIPRRSELVLPRTFAGCRGAYEVERVECDDGITVLPSTGSTIIDCS